MKIKLFFPLGLLLVLFCTPVQARYHTILSICGTTQGNGYNWAATLSWLSTQVMDAYTKAKEIERANPGAKVGISANCFAGGSSGSGVANVYESFLANPNINDPIGLGARTMSGSADPNRIFSPDEIYRIAKGLRFLAVGADMQFLFRATTYYRVARSQVSNFLTFGSGVQNVWGEQMGGGAVVADFATYIHFAQYANWDVIDQDVVPGQGILRDFPLSTFENEAIRIEFAKVKKLHDLISLPEHIIAQIDDQSISASMKRDFEKLGKAFQLMSEKVVSDLHSYNQEFFRGNPHSYLFRRMDGARPPLDHEIASRTIPQLSPLESVMARRPADGIMTITMAIPFDSREELEQAAAQRGFDFDQARAFVFMNEATAESVINSPEYRRMIEEDDPAVSRFVIAVIDEKFAQVNPSVREPILLDELVDEVNGDELRIKKIYDPAKDPDKAIQLVDASLPEANRSVFVIGGFPHEDQTSWLVGLHHLEKNKKLAAQADNVIAHHGLFGWPMNQANRKTTFAATNLSSRLFNPSRSSIIPELNLTKWYDWVGEFNRKWRPLMEGNGVRITRVKYDWNIRKLPAALARVSRYLAVMSHNETTEALMKTDESIPSRQLSSRLRNAKQAFNPDYFKMKHPGMVMRCVNFITSLIKK